jgi:glyoxylase-like metal-dependent hydrolase (beta-lactamase superfamily II)
MTEPDAMPASKKIGDIEVTAVSDGRLKTSIDVVLDLERAETERLVGGAHNAEQFLAVNSFLIRLGGKNLLVDAGAGTSMQPTLGRLPENLRAMGVAPEAIDIVLLTHMHPDHSNGLVDAGGQAVFPNAEIVAHEEEARFWLDREEQPSDSERVKRNTTASRRVFSAYRDRLRRVRDGEALTGVAAFMQPGHTPGHTAWLVHSGGESVLFWGDIVHLAAIQIPHPDAGLVFDVDARMACRSRRRVLDWAAADKLRVAGAHLDFPGFGYVTRRGSGYGWEAEG